MLSRNPNEEVKEREERVSFGEYREELHFVMNGIDGGNHDII